MSPQVPGLKLDTSSSEGILVVIRSVCWWEQLGLVRRRSELVQERRLAGIVETQQEQTPRPAPRKSQGRPKSVPEGEPKVEQ